MILNAISKKLNTVYFQAVLDKHNTNGTTMHARTSWRKDSGKKSNFLSYRLNISWEKRIKMIYGIWSHMENMLLLLLLLTNKMQNKKKTFTKKQWKETSDSKGI